MTTLKNVLLYLWQLPQNLVGLILLVCLKGEKKHTFKDVEFYYCPGFSGGISLGKYIILGNKNEKSIKHEYGHCVQSIILGWLYLIVVGLPSILHCWLCDHERHFYYSFYTEKWADKLGKVHRQKS